MPDPLGLGLRRIGLPAATMVQMVCVIALALGLLGMFHPHPRRQHHRPHGHGRRGVVMRVAMIFLWLRAAQQGSSRRRACPGYAVTTGVAQVGWVTLLLAGTRANRRGKA